LNPDGHLYLSFPIFSESGDDVLFGGDGNDFLSGEAVASGATTTGDDYLDGGTGADWLLGMLGDDVLLGGTENDRLYGDQAPAEAPNFELTYPGIVTPAPGASFTSVTGGADYLDGGEGDDYLQGDGGEDILLGGTGTDTLYGDDQAVGAVQEGEDWLDGGNITTDQCEPCAV
jgi:Ca2+-binding RTX toxin-like protein